MKKSIFIWAVLFFLGLFTLQCREKSQPEETGHKVASRAAVSVTVSTVKKGPVYRAYTAVGSLAPKDLARITPKVTGRISAIPVDEGDRVEEGTLLMQIDTFDYTRVVENATALKNQAWVNLDKAKRDFKRMERLYRDKTISEQKYRDVKTVFELAQYAYDQALVALKKAERDLKECRVLAPISGIVTNKHVNEGELTSPQVGAFVIMQMNLVKVEVDLPEEAYGYVESGNPCLVTVDAFPNETFKGIITMIYPTIDPVSRTVKITISLDNEDLKLRAGMTARAKVIQKARDNTISAPKAAFIKGEEGYFVYKMISGKVKKTDVTIGVRGDGVFEVTKGLAPGDQVVIKGFTGLRDNMAVMATLQDSEDISVSLPSER